MRVALVFTIAAGFTFGLAAGATTLVGRDPPPAPPATAVVWADRVFVRRHDLAAWLEARGSSYDVWAVRHPALAGTFDVRPGEPMAVGPEDDTSRAVDRGGSNSTVLLAITGVMLATVFALTAARASRRFAYHGGMRSTNLRQRIRLSNTPARISLAARSKARGTDVPASGEALSPRDSAPLVASTLLHVRSVARDDWASALTMLRRAVVEACRGAARLLSHARRRRSFPSIAWYATSGLLAFAVGAWVAIYLK